MILFLFLFCFVFCNQHCASIFHKDAILFAARKTAGISGDIRKAFHVCRVAVENTLLKFRDSEDIPMISSVNLPLIKMSDVQHATRDMFNSRFVAAVQRSTPFEALIFVSLASLKRHFGNERGFSILELLEKMEGVAKSFGDQQYLPVPIFGELLEMLNRLVEVSFD